MNSGESRLARGGELTLAGAQQLRTDLLDRLEHGRPVILDLQEITEIDLACLQVLAAAERSFSARGLTLCILGAPVSEQAWTEAGFPRGE